MNKKVKVLIVNEPLDMGGMDIAAVRLQQGLDKSKFETDYLVRRDYIGPLEPTVIKSGCNVYHVPNSELNYFKSYKFYCKFFKEHQYDIVHCHLPFFSAIVFMAAKKYGNPKCVAHGHFTKPYNNTAKLSVKDKTVGGLYRALMRIILKKICDVKLACSEQSGYYLFGKKTFIKEGIILNNGINYSDYEYSEDIRNKKRKELGIQDSAVVLGHVGMMNGIKNQKYVIDVFDAFHSKNENSILLLIGTGPDLESTKEYSRTKNLSDAILFLEERYDVNELYQVMDCFVFPSIHEGFPLTLIEAQASRLPCVISDTVTRKTKLNKNVEFISLNDSVSIWCEIIDELLSVERNTVDSSKLKENFDIKAITKKLEEIYLS